MPCRTSHAEGPPRAHGIRSGRDDDHRRARARAPAAARARPRTRPRQRARGRVPRRPARPLRPRPRRAARAAKAALGDRVFVLGHHYQRDEVIEFADVTGDSFKLAKEAAARPDAEWVVFCGVHFMAESADILTADTQTVVLPDLAAGCSMADMAAIDQVEECWDELVEAGVADVTVPVTYMNSSAAIKAFTGRHGGTICTSSNAKTALTWALDRGRRGRQGALPARPAPRPQHLRARPRPPARRLRGLGPAPPDGWPHPRAAARRHDDPVARALLGARPLLGRGRRGGPPRDPRRQGDRAPRVPPRGRRAGRRGRLHREDHRDHRRRSPGHGLGRRHRAQPRAAPGGAVPASSASPSSRRTSATAPR